ncbi:MAG: LruC domain-containing protein [Bacteroidetes bacterium]|nr:LruC domain-containing protein [Bacteroidota bacterium]
MVNNLEYSGRKGIFVSNLAAMSGKCSLLCVVLATLIMFSCKKNDIATVIAAKEMKDLQVSPDFTWETSHDVTFQIYSDKSTVINITSEASDIQYYRGFFNGLTPSLPVKLSIPNLIRQVRINGLLVAISENEVPVYLSKALKNISAGHPLDIPATGLIAAWHFNENTGTVAGDSTGGHNGVISSATWVNGIRGSALEYNGSSSQVLVAAAGFNPTGNGISFSFWFKLDAVGDKGTFIFQNLKYAATMDSQGRIVFTVYTPGMKSVNSGTGSRILDTDWHHAALTYDGSVMKIYLDGLMRTYAANTGNIQSSTADVYLGKQQTTNTFKGIIDETLVYDRALTETEILQIFGSTPDPGTGSSTLVSYWKLDENTGTTASDSKGTNNGVITGAIWGQGISGGCLTFDGTTGAVKVPSKLNLNPVYGITMMAWAKTGSNTTSKIIQKGDWDGHGIGQGNWEGWGGQIRLAGNTTEGLSWGGGLPILNQWYHIAMTYDGQLLKFYVNGQLRNSKPVTGLLYVNSRDLSIGSDDGNQKFFKGSIDEPKLFSSALDQTEIQANFMQPGNVPDRDGDGIPDTEDSYPGDPARAFNNYYPAAGFGSLAFEDLWPSTGDYDFNDLVLGYRFKTITNANNKISDVVATFVIRAIGGGLRNGFGFQLGGTAIAGTDVEVAGYKLKENFISLNPNGTEAGQENITVIVFDNAYKIMPSSDGFGINVQPGTTYINPDTTTISMSFKPNTYSIAEVGIDQFNPFIFVNRDRGKEIHLPDNPPTSLVNLTYFKNGNDDSDPALGKYYKTQSNLPWAIRVTSGFDYTIEKAQITSAYLKFEPWAESSGVLYPDLYQPNNGYRNESNIYQVP